MIGGELFQVPTELWTLIEKGNCVAWVGSGLSKIVGYLGWPETINELCSACGVQELTSSEEESPDKLIDKAEDCKEANLNAYEETLARLFGEPVVKTRRAFHLLMQLEFKAYVTTNFDPLLSNAGAIHERNVLRSYPDLPITMLEKAKCPIFYIHGLARQGSQAKGDNLVLARSDFRKAYEEPGSVSGFLKQLLTYYPVVFLGCSLAEPAMYETFQRVHGIYTQIQGAYPRANRPPRIAILPKPQMIVEDGLEGKRVQLNVERDEENRFQAMGIEVIRYEPSDYRRHEEVEQILECLCRLAKRRVSPVPGQGLEEVVPS